MPGRARSIFFSRPVQRRAGAATIAWKRDGMPQLAQLPFLCAVCHRPLTVFYRRDRPWEPVRVWPCPWHREGCDHHEFWPVDGEVVDVLGGWSDEHRLMLERG
jgi:hypothetical protein